ncbi:MAG: trans-acting enoyl reductase family protein [Gemmataceae bacterium]
MADFLIYGANGYTGELIAREAVRRGQRPVLSGRNAAAVDKLATELGLVARPVALDEPKLLDDILEGMAAVLHCAGPFAHTYRPMVDACLRTRTHYLDITGEIAVFEGIAHRAEEARAAGIVLLPGIGFDVVPSDCLAAHLKSRLPTATRLTLAIQTSGDLSRGTLTTMLEHAGHGGLIRKAGRLERVPAAWKTRVLDLGRGPVTTMTIPWGDVSTAFYTTGIGNIEVYSAVPASTRLFARLLPALGWLLRAGWVQGFLKRRIQSGPRGPGDEQRAQGWTHLWGEVTDDAGGRAISRLSGPEGYTFTVLTALAVVERILQGNALPGFHTPAGAFGADLVLEVENVKRQDET